MIHHIEPHEDVKQVVEYSRNRVFEVLERPHFTTSIADTMGLDWIRVDMRRLTPRARRAELKRWSSGVKIGGITYRIINGTSGAKGKRYIAFNNEDIKAHQLNKWFGVKNATRLSAILTPLIRVGTTQVRVKIVDKGDKRYGNSDGQAVISEQLALWMDDPNFDQPQWRVKFAQRKAVVKGTCVVNPRLDAEDIDMVVDSTSLKTEDPALKPGVSFDDGAIIGIVKFFDRPGTSDLSYQVMHALPDGVQAAIDDSIPNLVAQLTADMASPLTFVKASSDLPIDMRERELLSVFADLSLELGDERLLYSNPMSALIEELMSRVATQYCVSGGVVGKSMGSRGVEGLPKGVAIVDPASGIPEGPAIVWRNPFLHAGAAFVVRVKHSTFVEVDGWQLPTGHGSIALGETTGLASGRDQDGDELSIVSWRGAPRWVEQWIDWTTTIQVDSLSNGRAPDGEPPADMAEALDYISSQNVGIPANVATMLFVVKHKKPALAREAKWRFLQMIQAMQAAVDTKHWSKVDWEAVNEAREWALEHLTEMDTNFRIFANGSLKPWTHNRLEKADVSRRFPGTLFSDMQAGLRYGEVIDPKDYVSSATPIGRRMILSKWPELAWPVRQWHTLPNATFHGWIKPREGHAYEATIKRYEATVEALKYAHSLPDREREPEVATVLQHFSHIIGLAKDEDYETQKEVASALWHCGFRHERSEGRLLLRGMIALGPQVFLNLIREDFEKPVAVTTGIVYGDAPREYLEGVHLVKVTEPGDQNVTDSRGQAVQKMHFGKAAYLMIRPDEKPIQPGLWRAKLTRMSRKDGAPAKRSAFVLEPLETGEIAALS